MPSRISGLLRFVLGSAAVVLALLLDSSSRGQVGDLPNGGESEVTPLYNKNKNLLGKLLSGTNPEPFDPANKSHIDALDAGAKYITYCFTWPTFYQGPPGKIDSAFRESEGLLDRIAKNKTERRPEVALAFTKAVAARAREVINTSQVAIARINAARVLAKAADLGQGELADTLLELFNQEIARDEKSSPRRNDGVTYYLLHGMRDLLAIPNPPEPAPPILSPERERKLAEALLAFVNKPQSFTKETTDDEFEGYRSLRREAVRALAYCRAPGLKDKERPGMTLLRIMAREGLSPEPRIDERVEAALGVARMRPALDGKEFQPEYAVYQIALFVDVFGRRYNDSRRKVPPTNDLKEARPFRIYAARLIEALDALKTDTKNPYVLQVVDQCRKVLLPVEEGKDDTRTVDLTEKFLRDNPSPKDGLFAGVAGTSVKPANRAGE
jgi:hypothetical protein